MTTEWKDIQDYKGLYQVSNTGLVRSLERTVEKRMYGGGIASYVRKARIKKADVSSDGYHTIELSKAGRKMRFKVHRLVAQAFIPNTEGKPFINHIDNNPSNNNYSNLEWCTGSENTIHAVSQGRHLGLNKLLTGEYCLRGSSHPRAKLTSDDVLVIRASRMTQRELAKKFSVSKTAIKLIRQRINWKHV